MKIMEKTLEERDRIHQSIIDTYEARVSKFKADLEHEKNDKLTILRDFNQLKERYMEETKSTPET